MKRRQFISIASLTAGGWILAQMVPLDVLAFTDDPACFRPNPLIKICDDGKIILYVMKQEMGQNVNTSLPMILAEELEANPDDIIIEALPYDTSSADKFNTWGSASIRSSWMPLRIAGASARTMLINAAALEWNISPDLCNAENGKVLNTATNQSVTYQSLIPKASLLEIPKNPVLKNYKDFKIIGKGQKKSNIKDILLGKNKYSFDLKLPGMLYATVVRCPVYKGKVIKWDDTALKQLEGVIHIMEITAMSGGVDNRSGVAIVAKNSWVALRGQQLLKVEWDLGPYAKTNSINLSQKLKQAITTEQPVLVLDEAGKKAALAPINNLNAFKATYELPFMAHAAMEPVNCTAWFKDGKYELWGGFQAPGLIASILPTPFGISKNDILVNLMPMGGGFGRKEKVDNAAEAMQISKVLGKPVQVIFSRPDDIRADFYRPASFHQLTAVSSKTSISQWQHQQAITTFPDHGTEKSISKVHNGVGGTMGDFYYAAQTFRSLFYSIETPVPLGSWRSIAYHHNIFAIESFIDELAVHNRADPLEYRLNLLKPIQSGQLDGHLLYNPRRLEAVLLKCAEGIGWKSKPKLKRFRGIAACVYLHAGAYAAHAFEISINADKQITIHKVVCALDCGIVIDPEGLKAQIQGSLAWGLSAAIKDEITITNGAVKQQSFFDYDVMRMQEMPPLDIHIISNEEPPGGAGEICVPSVAPALCNAIAAATGKRIRKLPIQNAGYSLNV